MKVYLKSGNVIDVTDEEGIDMILLIKDYRKKYFRRIFTPCEFIVGGDDSYLILYNEIEAIY